jgi:hypothetical protein
MARENLIKCDTCGKTVSAERENAYTHDYGDPWYHVTLPGQGLSGGISPVMDFCSIECLVTRLQLLRDAKCA